MNFSLSPDQETLRRAARELFTAQSSSAVVRQTLEGGDPNPAELWRHLSELGFTGLAVPEAHGGQGLGLVEQAVVLEEAGRMLVPGPYLSTVTAAQALSSAPTSARERWLPGIASGAVRASLCIAEPVGRWDAEGIQTTAVPTPDGHTLEGTKLFCPDAGVADLLIVAAVITGTGDAQDRTALFAVEASDPGVTRTALKGFDSTRGLYQVGLGGVKVKNEALLVRGWSGVRNVLDRAAVALSAEMVGGAQQVLEMSVEYARTREQFGKPIGIYQAISHRLADMLVAIENARSVTYYAAWALETGAPDASRAASMAKAYVSDSYREVAAAGIQVHGGIGFTWEHDLHLHLRRAKASEVAYGDARHHRELVAQAIDL